ncbi:hypothetical protein Fmac_005783 [Flemingia macrophylla]|uniref:Uncharacterized protein n=1 Tax=Flemingia macrophylla TaxID=520843 RepID=A0ABD1N954_9FABA
MSVRIHREWVAYGRLSNGPSMPTNRWRKPSLKVITGISSLKVRRNHRYLPTDNSEKLGPYNGGPLGAFDRDPYLGFRKDATSKLEFFNERFKKGERELLHEIRRRKAWTNKQQPNEPNQGTPQDFDEDQRSSSTSSSCGYTTLVDENKRLKKENEVLNSELTSMKRK